MQILRLMADGQFHSGDELGDLMGVSRAAVWKQIQKLQKQGFDIYSVRGKGYRLAEPLSLLDAGRIRGLVPDAGLSALDVFDSIASTNDKAMEKAVAGNGHGYVCLAEQQTAGRGRRGRQWVSPYGKNIYMSAVWQFLRGASALEGLSLAVGVAVVTALQRIGVDGLSLKWPNDILIRNHKLGGVLLEMAGDPAGVCQVVIGIGINTQMPEAEGENIDQQWVDLHRLGIQTDRNELAALVITELLVMLREFQQAGFAAFKQRWMALDAYQGQKVCVGMGLQKTHGIERGVDETGGLLVETAAGIEVFKGGEVSLRKEN